MKKKKTKKKKMFRLRIVGDVGFEFWMDVPEYEGFYQASTYGSVRRVSRYVNSNIRNNRKVLRVGKVLKPSSVKGYLRLTLSKENIVKNQSVHRLVSTTFIPNPNNYPCVNHRDEDPKNNRVENLEWCDVYYNVHYGTGIERRALNRMVDKECKRKDDKEYIKAQKHRWYEEHKEYYRQRYLLKKKDND